jgi:hypothetical protein
MLIGFRRKLPTSPSAQPSQAQPSPAQTKSYIQALKDRYRRASNPRKSKQTRREEKQSLGRGEDTIFQAITKIPS